MATDLEVKRFKNKKVFNLCLKVEEGGTSSVEMFNNSWML